MHGNSQEKTTTDEKRQHRCASIGDKGQGNTDDRNGAGDHGHIDEHIEKKAGRQAESHQPAELVAAGKGDHEAVNQQQEIKPEQKQRAEDAKFFGQNDEDKIGMFFGQKLELALCALTEAFAEQSARAERNFRLQNVIACAERIGARVKECH